MSTKIPPKQHRKDQYCGLCPCKLGTETPSPMAIERIHVMQANQVQLKKNKKKSIDDNTNIIKEESINSCDWYINSAEHYYCFWEYAKHISEPISDREICQLLGISSTQLKDDFNSAIKKLKLLENNPMMKDFSALLNEKIQADRNLGVFTVYDTDDSKLDKIEDDLENELDIIADIEAIKKRRKGKSMTGQPKHRDGKKTDIYFRKPKNDKKNKH